VFNQIPGQGIGHKPSVEIAFGLGTIYTYTVTPAAGIVAVRIVKLDHTDNPVGDAVDLELYEVAQETIITPRMRVSEQASQQGDRTLFIRGQEYNDLKIPVRIAGTATEAKLNIIRNYAKAGGTFRVYPYYYSDVNLSYKCYIRPSIILTKSTFGGRSMAGTVVDMLFRGTTMTSPETETISV